MEERRILRNSPKMTTRGKHLPLATNLNQSIEGNNFMMATQRDAMTLPLQIPFFRMLAQNRQ
ncbi:hypothetical protein GV64_02400 [Endozoicomonas elysicola]|uniref:Uncharacterized protein n=1 Tax=Endozoicomonas elysicola TaxID=305900 RepID=A0A081K6G9_9GAMM|nr:hypothetical protein GV64_02400 [Endozoicomonas elysicola]